MGRGTSGKGMVIEDKGMRQTDCCLCEWLCFGVWVCACLRIVCVGLMGGGKLERASSPQGVCDWEGNGELGLWEYEVEVEEGEKYMMEDGSPVKVEEEK